MDRMDTSSIKAPKGEWKEGSLVFEGIRDFDCEQVFECGQCFRWNRQDDGSYDGIAGGRVARITFEPYDPSAVPGTGEGRLVIRPGAEADGRGMTCEEEAAEESFWVRYLDLGRDYGAIKARLSAEDPVMERAIEAGAGIRILSQDLWETIVSFIISQNNNIPRIKGCIERLAERFGEPCRGGTALPSCEKLASLTEEDLAPVRLGYRARYLVETGRAVAEKGLPESMEELSKLCGVGPKVANCIGLFGMGLRDSFPIDVWVRRVMAECYGFDEKDMKGMAAFAREKFGELGGYAQQYLFYYIRGLDQKNR